MQGTQTTLQTGTLGRGGASVLLQTTAFCNRRHECSVIEEPSGKARRSDGPPSLGAPRSIPRTSPGQGTLRLSGGGEGAPGSVKSCFGEKSADLARIEAPMESTSGDRINANRPPPQHARARPQRAPPQRGPPARRGRHLLAGAAVSFHGMGGGRQMQFRAKCWYEVFAWADWPWRVVPMRFKRRTCYPATDTGHLNPSSIRNWSERCTVITSERHHEPGWACRIICLWAAPPKGGQLPLLVKC
eukprot:gene23169-biopygen17793